MNRRRLFALLGFTTTCIALGFAAAGFPPPPCPTFYPPPVLEEPAPDFCSSLVWKTRNGTEMRLKPRAGPPRRVIDAVTFNTEFEMLDIRLMTLWPVVDHFVVVESNSTHSGRPKPLHLERNARRYSEFASKLTTQAFVAPFPTRPPSPPPPPPRTVWRQRPYNYNTSEWIYEHAQRDFLLEVARGALNLTGDDVMFVSDLDEVPNPDYVRALKHCDGWGTQVCLQASFFVYSFQFEYPVGWTMGPKASLVSALTSPNQLRAAGFDAGNECVVGGGWHCSHCFRTMEEIINKARSFAHTEFDKPEYTEDHDTIRFRARCGIDPFDRNFYEQVKHADISGVAPPYVARNQGCYLHLSDRKRWARTADAYLQPWRHIRQYHAARALGAGFVSGGPDSATRPTNQTPCPEID